MYGGAHIVDEAGEGEFRRTGTTAHRILGLQHDHGAAVASQLHGSGQAVRPGADDHRVVRSAAPLAHVPDATLYRATGLWYRSRRQGTPLNNPAPAT